jgi:DNA-binding NarL/FixJ family response regulator
VFAQLARGLSNQRIAEHLHVTEHTVKFHVRHILAKLGVRSRGEAAAMARAARF